MATTRDALSVTTRDSGITPISPGQSVILKKTSILDILPPELIQVILRLLLLNPEEALSSLKVKDYPKCEGHKMDEGNGEDEGDEHKHCWQLEQSRNFHFHPKILRTCQRLRQEGEEILYKENSIRLNILADHWTECEFMTVTKGKSLFKRARFPPGKFSKFEFKIHALYFENEDSDGVSIQWYGDLLQQTAFMCQRLRKRLDMKEKEITIDVTVTKWDDSEEDKDPRINSKAEAEADDVKDESSDPQDDTSILKYLSSFELLRCKAVNVILEGKLLANQPEWARKMTSTTEAVDLFEIHHQTKEFCGPFFGSEEIRAKIWEALVERDEQGVRAARVEAVEFQKAKFEDDYRQFLIKAEECLSAG